MLHLFSSNTEISPWHCFLFSPHGRDPSSSKGLPFFGDSNCFSLAYSRELGELQLVSLDPSPREKVAVWVCDSTPVHRVFTRTHLTRASTQNFTPSCGRLIYILRRLFTNHPWRIYAEGGTHAFLFNHATSVLPSSLPFFSLSPSTFLEKQDIPNIYIYIPPAPGSIRDLRSAPKEREPHGDIYNPR